MPLSNAGKIGIGLISAGAIGGASYAGYSHFSRDNFKDKLGVSVLNLTGNDNSKEWELRLNELKGKQTGLDSTIEKVKNKSWQDLRNWCNGQSDNAFSKETDTVFQNFEEFCTWKVGDKTWENKILSSVADTHADWGKAHGILKAKEKNTLSQELQEVYETKNTDNSDKKAMHKWCTDKYKKTWKGDADNNFKEIKEYCKTV